MHICFITSEYPKEGFPHGGVGTFVHTISRQLVEKGHNVSVVGINSYLHKNEFQDDNDVKIYRLKPKVLKGLTWYFNFQSINKKIKEVHEESPIDIIESTELGLAFITKIKSIRYIIRLHGGHHFFAEAENRTVSPWKAFQEKRSFRKADAFVAPSNYVKLHTSKYLSYNNKKIETIRLPINLEVFKPLPHVQIETSSILFAGTICEKKGIQNLVKAMPKIIDKVPNAKLLIYGRDWFFPDGSSYIAFLKNEIIPRLGDYASRISFMGVVSLKILATKYASAEICVFPSLMETQGLVAPEAMAMEKMVLFSECGPGPETIEHKKTGLLCNPYDIDDIANNIIWALKHKNESSEIAIEARKFVLTNFNIETIVESNLNFYNQL